MLKRTIFLLLILPFMLLACSTSDDAAQTENNEVIEAENESAVQEQDEPEVEESETADSVATVYAVDTAASTLTWTGSKPIGDSHSGTIDLASGELAVQDGELVNGDFVIDMTTIAEENNTTRLEGHLASDDFFGVATYPEAMLNIVTVEETADGMYDVTADLTIKEITNQITFPVEAAIEGGTLTGSAEITFDRSLWDVRYGSGSFFDNLGDDLINDEIEMVIEIVANS